MIALAAIMIAVLSVSIVDSGRSDAWVGINDDIWGEGFATNSEGTLHILMSNSEDVDITIGSLTVYENGREIYKKENVVVPKDGGVVDLTFRISEKGEHTLTIVGEPSSMFFSGTSTNTVTITVKESIFSKTSTYIAIIAIAILVVIAVYLHMRNAPVKKPDITFTELEQQKRESRGEDTPKASATERRRYDKASEPQKETAQPKASKPKESAKPAPAPAEKKSTPFTDLEKEKGSKKKESASSGEQPKKLKYVSSRRK
jgi:hypothetical protein